MLIISSCPYKTSQVIFMTSSIKYYLNVILCVQYIFRYYQRAHKTIFLPTHLCLQVLLIVCHHSTDGLVLNIN